MPYYRLFYHVIWTTKERLPLINATNQQPIFAAITSKVNAQGGIVHAINAMDDHVHLVVTIPPWAAIGTFIGQIKGSSSYVAARQTASDPNFAWQSEYGILSISETHLPAAIEYVRRQQEYHAANTLQPTFESVPGAITPKGADAK